MLKIVIYALLALIAIVLGLAAHEAG